MVPLMELESALWAFDEGVTTLSRGLRLPSRPAATASGWRVGSRRAR